MRVSRNSRVRLTQRDLGLLEDLFWQRLMSSDHILRLGYFTGRSRCNRRLSQLASVGAIARYVDAPLGLSKHYIYFVTKQGRQLLISQSRIDSSDAFGFFRSPSRTMSSHLLTLCEIRASLNELGVLQRWLPEPRCKHAYFVGDDLRTFKPDGLAVITGEPNRYVFVEADLGTNSKQQIRLKLLSYERYQAEAFAEIHGADRFDVVFVAISNSRAKVVTRLMQCSPIDIRVGTLANLRELFL